MTGCSTPPAKEDPVVELRVLETSDLHMNLMDFDYFKGVEDPTIGLARAASLIHAARDEAANHVLVDNGDLLQGSPMGDYMASLSLQEWQLHPAYKAMNTLNYAVGNIGNHEFNYGLEFLSQAVAGANFPYISANVYCAVDNCLPGINKDQPLFDPWLIKPTRVVDTQGQTHTLNIGYIGFVPPQIEQWDRAHLHGKVYAKGIVESANTYVPLMKQAGADIIVAIPHSGIGSAAAPHDPDAENASYALTQVKGIDAIMFGHSHAVFPHPDYSSLPNTDIKKGLLNGVPSVMPGRWGDNLGIVDLTLTLSNGQWQVIDSSAQAKPIFDSGKKAPLVTADAHIHGSIAHEHEGTLDFVDAPIGKARANMYSFLSLIQDDPTVQIVADAQIARVKQAIADLPDNERQHYEGIPVVSAAAPFKAGGRHKTPADAAQYVEVDSGELKFRHAADLYLYPNTMVAVKVSGAELKDWLECSANQFNQIDPQSTSPQSLINWTHPTFNFDVIDGIQYRIDITQPARFDRNCQLVNPNASRITSLSYTDDKGNTLTGEAFAAQSFIVATNNYRAYGGQFAGTGPEYVVMELPDTNREVLAAYIKQQTSTHGSVNPSADHNWGLVNISNPKLNVLVQTQSSDKADRFVAEQQKRPMVKTGVDELGFAVYQLDMSQENPWSPIKPKVKSPTVGNRHRASFSVQGDRANELLLQPLQHSVHRS
ncbi:bifunctional 2',3'-cyclic-nucleotide 2'-phosphodiesterase/3'-nucleotidase [Shewanella corallii]|uniref:Bifunctional 2',3'-cyclic-nucleotide 2'-phosphodiesterase/3'-nucleotidase n=2 Tax=Shewanella corallii TaxID=560080 RepID=A0ABT0N615_9GAMM|nr:bifunctional 2',3'-cyclic-nucleotide 2'-phosphodiesterase/3'-nucleotidase [Shewanella corallii]